MTSVADLPPLFLLGEPDWFGMLIYALIFSTSVGGFVLAVYLICSKVFGGGRERALSINADAAEGRTDERR